MEDDDLALNDLADAILNGTPADLDSAHAEASHARRAAIRQARILAKIAELHRSLPAEVEQIVAVCADDTTGRLTSWGRLTIFEEIGRGAFGAVYRAKDPRLDREVALKLLQPGAGVDALLDDSLAASVIEEGRLLARVHHPNIVTIYDADRIGGRVGLTMEFVRGRTLQQVLQEGGPLSPTDVASIGIEISHALAAVHEAGLLHRDIKAQNVMRRDDGRLVLMDFGAGRVLDERDAATEMAGTPLYLAPEIFDGHPATVPSDVYSVGVLLYHLLTRAYPVAGRTIRELREHHRSKGRTRLGAGRADVPDALARVIDRALEENPADRYSSADEMAMALTASHLPAPALRPSRLLTGAMLLAGLAAVAVLSVAVLNVGGWRDRLLGRPGQPSRVGPALGQAVAHERALTVRQVLVPGEYLEIGRPSIDGRYLPFVDRNLDLAVKDLGTGEIHRLTNRGQSDEYVDGYRPAAISPDSRWIAYAWGGSGQGIELRILDLQHIVAGEAKGRPDRAEPRVLLRRGDIDPVEWSADGTAILSLVEDAAGSLQVALVSASDGRLRPIKELGMVHPQGLSLSPDGRFIAYDRPQADSPGMRDIFVLATDGSGEWPLIEHPANDLFPQWTPDGDRLLFASTRTGALGLWAAGVWDGRLLGDPEAISRDMGRMMPLGLTRDGAFFYHLRTGLVDVYTASLDPATGTVVGKPQPVSPNYVGSNISSNWSHDGRYLAYVSIRSPVAADRFSRTLTVRDMVTGEERDLWPRLAFFIAPHWSPDGRTVLVNGYDLGQRCCWHQIDVATGRASLAVPVDWTKAPPMSAVQWAPDGRALLGIRGTDAFVTRDLARGVETKLLDFRVLGIDRLTPPPQGAGLQLSPDGRSIAFSGWIGSGDTAQTVLKIFPLGGTALELARSGSKEPTVFQGWTPDGLELLFTRQEEGKEQRGALTGLWRVSAWGGEPRPVGLDMVGLRDVHISPDGAWLTFTAGWETGDVRVMENSLPVR